MTENHNYNIPAKGIDDWNIPLNDNFKRIDTDVEIREQSADLDQYQPKLGAKFFATDTGRIYIGTGDRWKPLVQTGRNPSFGGVGADYSSVKSRDNEMNVRAMGGSTLAERIDAALDLIETSGRIRVPRPKGGGVWEWGGQLDIDVGQYRGITLDLDRGVEIEYGGDGWALAVSNISGREQTSTFAIEGIDAEFIATGNPQGCIRSDDVGHVTIRVNTRNFRNSAGDATAILIRNVDHYTEGWKLEGDHRASNRSVDFAPASVTGGSGTESFVDGRAENLSVKGTDFGMRLRGNHRGNVFDNVHFFFGADDSVGLALDGLVSQTLFVGPRFDDTNGHENEVGIETREGFESYDGKPLFMGPEFSTVATHAVKLEHIHDLWSLRTDGSQVGFVDLESEVGMLVGRDGSLSTQNETGTVFEVDGNGNVRESGNWQTGSRPTFLDSLNFPTLSSDPAPPAGKSVFYVSDGSSGVTGDDGDVVVSVTNSTGTTKTKILADFSEM